MSMFITITEGAPTYTAEQMWLLLAALKEQPKIDLHIREPSDLEDEDDDSGPDISGPSEHLEGKAIGYTVSVDTDPGFVIDVQMLEVVSQEMFNGEFVTRRVFWFAQHDGWDLDTQQYVEEWYHTMQLRLRNVEPNVSVNFSAG